MPLKLVLWLDNPSMDGKRSDPAPFALSYIEGDREFSTISKELAALYASIRG
jgi:hypothetical protein